MSTEYNALFDATENLRVMIKKMRKLSNSATYGINKYFTSFWVSNPIDLQQLKNLTPKIRETMEMGKHSQDDRQVSIYTDGDEFIVIHLKGIK